MPLTPLTGTLGHKRAAHLLRRTTFGHTISDIKTFSGLTVSEAIERLFTTNLPDPPLPIDDATGLEWITTGANDNNSEEGTLQEYFKGWFLGQMLSVGIPDNYKLSYSMRERITFFLHSHFTTQLSKVSSSRSAYFQNQLFRMFAFDNTADPDLNFKTLAKKICVDNSMLKFLDGSQNVKGLPNENYAREFFELYTIGRGLEGTFPETGEYGDYFTFKEQDVQASARVLSGFTTDNDFLNIDADTGLPRGVVRGGATASSHDNDPKQFSDRFGSITIQPDPLLLLNGEATEASALDEIDQLVEMIFAQEEAAKHICRKVYRFFVYHQIDEAIDGDIIADMANILRNNGFKLQALLETLFQSREFYEGGLGYTDDQFGAIIKSPMDLTLSAIGIGEVQLPDYITDTSSFYEFSGKMVRWIEQQGMRYYDPFEVAGYAAYHQFPIFNRNWISTNHLLNRYEFVSQLLEEDTMSEEMSIEVNLIDLIRNNIPNAIAENAQSLIIELVKYLLPVSENLTFDRNNDETSEVTAERLHYFLQAFLYDPQIDVDPEGSWSFRWNNPVDNEVVSEQLRNLFNAIMQSPEYQLI